MDIIYPLIKSKWGEEIKYSLRSLATHLKEDYKVTIIGDYLPKWASDKLNYIPIDTLKTVPTTQTQHNQGAILKYIAINLELERFYWFNDDTYLLKDATKYDLDKVYVKENSSFELILPSELKKRTPWQKLLYETRQRLNKKGYSSINFETHLPYPFDSKKILKISKTTKLFKGYDLTATLYYNMNPENTYGQCNQVKIGCYAKQKVQETIKKLTQIEHAYWFNHDDKGIDVAKEVLPKMFPNKCRFEK